MSASYKDYGYQSAGLGWAHGYLLPHLQSLLGQPRGAILDLGCGNGAIARALLAQGSLNPNSKPAQLNVFI